MMQSPSLVSLRGYQKKAISDVRAALKRSRSVLLQMPTGSGKTYTAADFIRQEAKNGPVWFICHRREIIKQTAEKFSETGLTYDVIAPDYVPGEKETGYFRGAPIKIASIDTIRARLLTITDRPVLAVIDEAHHTPAGTWADIYEWLGDIPIVGLTATPERLDKKPLSPWFNELVRGPESADLVEIGDLARPRIFAPSQPDLSAAKISKAGDYTEKSLDQIMNTPVLIGNAVEEYKRHASGARAIVFTTSVKAAENVAAQFNAAGIPASQVNAKTPVGERDDAIRALAAGRIKVLANYGVFTEGVDVKEADAVILMRPTKSLALYLQMVGRGMRKKDGANEVIVLDHAGMVWERGNPLERHDWSLEGGAWRRFIQRKRAEGGAGVRKCPSCSEVHFDRPEVCKCGHVFASGREVGEFDGVLKELNDEPPPGHVTKEGFGRLCGVAGSSVTKWIERGLPVTRSSFISIADGMRWVESNRDLKRVERYQPPQVDEVNLYESKADFARRHSVSSSMVGRMAKAGMPTAPNGWPKIKEATAWMEQNWINQMRPPHEESDKNKVESRSAFARRFGLRSVQALGKWVEEGLPCASNGWVYVEQGVEWVVKNKAIDKHIPPPDVADRSQYERAAYFARRVGVSSSLVTNYWKRRNIPCASNGWVHIRKGLEWVRDNTSIEIPSEAWPADDEDGDNG